MSDIVFHFSREEIATLEAANDNDPEYRVLRKMAELNRVLGEKTDKQLSRDGYGVQDACKQ